MNKPLTIEELKALPLGEWVWVIPNSPFEPYYAQVIVHTDKPLDKEFWVNALTNVVRLFYADYGTKWTAYKNKEQVEGKEDIDTLAVENEVLKQDKENLERTIEEINEALKANGITIDSDGNIHDSRVKEAKRQTAKEILTTLKDWRNRNTPIAADIQELAVKYGVEVDE